nr:hypothetical protein [Tanacetum cinerariifolium]
MWLPTLAAPKQTLPYVLLPCLGSQTNTPMYCCRVSAAKQTPLMSAAAASNTKQTLPTTAARLGSPNKHALRWLPTSAVQPNITLSNQTSPYVKAVGNKPPFLSFADHETTTHLSFVTRTNAKEKKRIIVVAVGGGVDCGGLGGGGAWSGGEEASEGEWCGGSDRLGD